MPENLERIGALEAVLAVAARPLSDAELMQILQLTAAELAETLTALGEALAAPQRGLRLERVSGGWWLTSKPAYATFVADIGRPVREGGLSPAALETLAIVAYRQPITRPAIERLRGVRSEGALNALLERGLIHEVGREEGPGRPILYGTTDAFLIHFGLDSLADLPPLPPAEALRLTEGAADAPTAAAVDEAEADGAKGDGAEGDEPAPR